MYVHMYIRKYVCVHISVRVCVHEWVCERLNEFAREWVIEWGRTRALERGCQTHYDTPPHTATHCIARVREFARARALKGKRERGREERISTKERERDVRKSERAKGIRRECVCGVGGVEGKECEGDRKSESRRVRTTEQQTERESKRLKTKIGCVRGVHAREGDNPK